MKTKKNQWLLFGTIIMLLVACSKDSENNTNSKDLIIGEWLFISENDYQCGTEEIVVERLGSNQETVQTMIFTEGGAYMNYDDGELVTAEDQMGTWRFLGNDVFEFNYSVNGEPEIDMVKIEFDGENTMKFGVDSSCFDSQGESRYTFTVWTRN